MGYCHWCGRWAAFSPAAMCARCRDTWQPATIPPDPGHHDGRRP
jgi:hypothetical protein